MNIVNILIAGVGGQGLVLTTEIIAKAAFFAGYEVATNDVIGLSQRGGKINGSIRFGEKVPTPNVPSASASVLLGLEKLETLRFVDEVIPGGTVLMNRKEIYPNPVLMEKAAYPSNIEEEIQSRNVRFVAMDSDEQAKAIGNIRVANTILIGALSTLVDIEERHFAEAIVQSVPPKTIRANLQAFVRGRELLGAPVSTELPEEGAKEAAATPTAESPYAEVAVKEPHPMDPAGGEMSVVNDASAAPKGDPATKASAPEMEVWICTVCGYAYDPVAGDPDHDVAPGTPWEEVPEDWTCPLCGVGKDAFERQ